MAKHACVDIGGTFTDGAILDEKGKINVFKSPTTHHDYTEGILNVLKIAAEYYNEPLEEFVNSCSPSKGGLITHGSTIATNAILEKKVAKVALICTKGFRDVLLFREGPVKDPFDFQLDYPEPYIPRYLTMPVTERINSEGGIETPLDEGEIKEIVKQLKKWDIKAIAVTLLWSILNPAHEKRIKEVILEEWPDIEVVLSHEVNPAIREYRRFVSTAMDASLRPIISNYIQLINTTLQSINYDGEVGMLNSSGGITTAEDLTLRPLLSIDSGPALAPVAGKYYADEELAENNLITMDMGGTSFDVSVMRDGVISSSREMSIGDEIPGVPRIDIHSIGAGGGSIAWVDSGNMVRVGPISAGSTPGPACYGKGGVHPTVTDANVVLGYINPDNFNDRRMKLDSKLAAEAIRKHIAEPLNLSLEEAAFTIWSTINANMITAIQDITIWQGIDPRDFVMVSGGGACGVHASPLADGLEMKRILIPKTAGTLSAAGGIFSDIVSEFSISQYVETRSFDHEAVNNVLRELMDKALEFFARNNIPPEKREFLFYVEGRYPYQVWEIQVPLEGIVNQDNRIDAAGVAKIAERFHEEHDKKFAVKEPNAYVECLFWGLKAIGKRQVVGSLEKVTQNTGNETEEGSRKAFFKKLGGMVDTPVFSGLQSNSNKTIVGPAIIEEPTTTIIVYPDDEVKVTKYNNYYITKNNK